jgi:ABC-type lipoprotein export system ATPase subunit
MTVVAMIKALHLKFGRTLGSAPEIITLSNMTIFVGPNNSGKSKILREIYSTGMNGFLQQDDVLINDLSFLDLDKDTVEKLLSTLNPKFYEDNRVRISKYGHSAQMDKNFLIEIIAKPTLHKRDFGTKFLNLVFDIISGHNRIQISQRQNAGNYLTEPQNMLQDVFLDDEKRAMLRKKIFEAFGMFLVINPLNSPHLEIRMSKVPPSSVEDERGLTQKTIDFQKNCIPIDEFSDGVKAYTGILLYILVKEPQIIAIDEPEAFLHPQLAFMLGKEMALAAKQKNKRVFASTHSANFVMGCITGGCPTNIVRLTYRDGIATARLLEYDKIVQLMRNPLLRSTKALEGIFSECVVITEADTDRAFYEEINQRMLQIEGETGIQNSIFLHAQNKQTIKTIMAPLREFGIPAAAIVDIDILKDAGDWRDLLKAANVPFAQRSALLEYRALLARKLQSSGLNMTIDGGIALLDDSDREAAENLFDDLEKYGIFVVRNGAVESWLKGLGVSGKGPRWLISMFEKLGEDPTLDGYILPAADDVWAFMARIRTWCLDPTRRGIPD